MPKWYLDITFLYLLFSVVNLLNYIDRGIIPGATNEINNFIQDSVDTDKPDVFLGLLQSSFIIGFMLGSVLFGNMVHTYSRFTLTGIGCSIWILAVMLSGCAFYANSYVFLLFARIISGFGEASMQCSIPPWISATASPHNRGLWLGIFYTAIPVGTAIGYAYSATLATTVGWQWAFFVEGLVMFPFVLFMFSIAKDFPCDMTDHQAEDVNTALLGENSVVGVAAGPPSLWEECRQVMILFYPFSPFSHHFHHLTHSQMIGYASPGVYFHFLRRSGSSSDVNWYFNLWLGFRHGIGILQRRSYGLYHVRSGCFRRWVGRHTIRRVFAR